MVAVQVVSETIPLKVMVLSACATVDSALQAENQGTRQKFFTHLHIYSHIHYKRQSVRQLLYAAILENEIQAARRHACIYMTYGL